jgi:LacI family transcriptional regulator
VSAEKSVRRRVTITDVARHAGVSTAAVSKVLREAYGVSPQMKQRVGAAIDELGYRPHAAARGMRGQTYTVGLVLGSIRNPFFGDLLDGVTDALSPTPYQVFVGVAGYGAATQKHATESMVDRQMDGLILIAPGMARPDVLELAEQTPTVVIGHHDSPVGYDSVVHDDGAGARLVIEHLTGLGHERIAHTSTSGARGSRWRLRPEVVLAQGYTAAMTAHGGHEHAQVVTTSSSEEGGYEAGRRLLNQPDPPTAIFASTDAAALGVFRAAAELGLRIPADLSLVGYNNTVVSAYAPVQLTTVDQAGVEMGATATRLLLERIGGRGRPMIVSTSPRLVIRGTTAPPRS